MLETPELFCIKVSLTTLVLMSWKQMFRTRSTYEKVFWFIPSTFWNGLSWFLTFDSWKKSTNIVTLILQPTLWCKVCVVKRFYFIRIELIRSCQEWLSKAASIAVAARRTVRVAEIWIIIVCVWRAADLQVMTSSKCRTNIVTAVCGIPCVRAVLSCLIELYRCPSWPVYQREQKGLCIVLIANATRL